MINQLYDRGHIIKFNTARYMMRNKDNIQKTNKQELKKTKQQLLKWGVKFHKLFITKPNSDIYWW